MNKISEILRVFILISLIVSKSSIFVHAQVHNHGAVDNSSSEKMNKEFGEKTIKYWTCSMHPQIKLPKKGLCPLCAMDLIPVYEDEGGDAGDVSLTLSKSAQLLAEVQTTPVMYQEVSHNVRLVGKVDYDETRLSYISAWASGRIARLFVDFTGIRVRKGDHLIELYSPELISAQQEYIQAMESLERTKDSSLSVIKQTAETTIKSSKDKLRLFGITEQQISVLESTKKVQEHLTIYSSISGTVINKNGFEGMYVKTGDKIYTIADLSQVWLYLDAYESDIQWLHYGQNVTVEAEAYSGEKFPGKIAFIDPFVDEKTRTIKLRVNVNNPHQKLKPGMFVRANIEAKLTDGGKIYEEHLAGKYICPMHPEIIKDAQGICDICEMDLIDTSEFGFADQKTERKKVLVIPRSAPLITGERAIVYVEVPGQSDTLSRYEGREVVLGPRAGDMYIVKSGLYEGEKVVTKGAFKIDSAMQIQAKPSMMNPLKPKDMSMMDNMESMTHLPDVIAGEGAGVLMPAIKPYLKAVEALAADDFDGAYAELQSFEEELGLLFERNIIADGSDGIGGYVHAMMHQVTEKPESIRELRDRFGDISQTLKFIVDEYGYNEGTPIYLMYCPMAFKGKGGYWFQNHDKVTNPYYGAKMFRCGSVKNEYGR